MSTATAVATIQARLPMPQGMSEQDVGKWRVLCESIFPTARTPEAIMLAMDYCRVRNLDIMKKPVHVVPMWSSSLGREVETVWPSIAEVQITASRTGAYAGMDEPKWGNDVTRKFAGIIKNNAGETVKELSFPSSCSVTVYRMVNGVRCPFTEPVFWLEAYARIGKTELPNDQWSKRPRGMLLKVAKAFSLRAAFPEEGEHTAEEMEGRVIEEVNSNGMVVDTTKPLKKASPFKTAGARKTFYENCIASIEGAENVEVLNEVIGCNKARFEEMRDSGNEHDALAVDGLNNAYKVMLVKLKQQRSPEPEDDATFDEEEVPAYLRTEMEAEQERKAAQGY